jgi:hypothetical protein
MKGERKSISIALIFALVVALAHVGGARDGKRHGGNHPARKVGERDHD